MFLESIMAETAITIEETKSGYHGSSNEILEVAQAAQRARDQVADVLMKVKREYPEWTLPLELTWTKPA